MSDEVAISEKSILDELIIDPGYSCIAIVTYLEISKKTVAEHIKVLKQKGVIERTGTIKQDTGK